MLPDYPFADFPLLVHNIRIAKQINITADSRLFELPAYSNRFSFPVDIPKQLQLKTLQLFEPSVVRTFVYSNQFLNPRDQ